MLGGVKGRWYFSLGFNWVDVGGRRSASATPQNAHYQISLEVKSRGKPTHHDL